MMESAMQATTAIAEICFVILGHKDNFVAQPTWGYNQIGAVRTTSRQLVKDTLKCFGAVILLGHTPWRRRLSEAIDLDLASRTDISRRYALWRLSRAALSSLFEHF